MNGNSLQGLVALVSGGAGAIGQAICARLWRGGASVVVADLDTMAAGRAAASLESGEQGSGEQVAIGTGLDVASRESTLAVVDSVVRRFGRLDVVVNNAGINRPGWSADMAEADWDAVLEVNLKGAFLLSQAAIPQLERQRGGRIVNIASRTWLSGTVPAYTASKAGLIGLTRSLARELGPLGVTVNAVAPGTVPTPFNLQSRDQAALDEKYATQTNLTPLGRLATPDDVAAAVAFFASPEAGFITGEVLHVAGGLQLAPL
jgi:NAD(P)-dependent dehydrogenase (short-subunit alcohol dehydrogenase family)